MFLSKLTNLARLSSTLNLSGLATGEAGISNRVNNIISNYGIQAGLQTKTLKSQNNLQTLYSLDFNVERSNESLLSKVITELAEFSEVCFGNDATQVEWFPEHINDLNKVGKYLLEKPDENARSHPYFVDKEFHQRRMNILAAAKDWKIGEPIPRIEYTENDKKTWGYIYNHLKPLHNKYFAKQFNDNFKKLEKYCNLGENKISQLEDISNYLRLETGFRIKPVHGILSGREFLNCLAHRVFCSTQYLRHHANPEYSPEPDLIHEVFGHMAMLADPEFADLSQKIGMLSLGQSDENIAKIGALYLYTIEFGSFKEGEDIKCYGAGIASCIDEIKNFVNNPEKRHKLDPASWLPLDYPIETVQNNFFVADSLKDATDSLIRYSRTLDRPFLAWYDHEHQKIITNKPVEMKPQQ
jgi:phenylalanine-4-hydroxylase